MKTNKKSRTRLQIRLAHEIIKNCPSLKLNEVSSLANIPDRSNFRKYFQRRYGITPRQYKNKVIEKKRRKAMIQCKKKRIKDKMHRGKMIARIRITKMCNILLKLTYICNTNKSRHNGK